MERKKLIKFDVSSMSYKRHRMTKSVDNTTNILKRKRKTSTSSSSGVEISLNKSAFPEIDGHITNLVKSKALNHNLESHSEIKDVVTQIRDHPYKTSFFRGEGSKIGRICRRIVVKNCLQLGQKS